MKRTEFKFAKSPAPEPQSGCAVLAFSKVSAGFPSPADDYMESTLDLNTYLIKNPAATFFVRVDGESMTGAGIFPNDLLVVDRSVAPRSGNIVIAALDGEFAVKRLHRHKGRVELRAENPKFAPVVLAEWSELEVWGVVTYVLHGV